MPTWTSDELTRIGNIDELRLAWCGQTARGTAAPRD
jgi:hypothetical protein